jgi:hypothetical protein
MPLFTVATRRLCGAAYTGKNNKELPYETASGNNHEREPPIGGRYPAFDICCIETQILEAHAQARKVLIAVKYYGIQHKGGRFLSKKRNPLPPVGGHIRLISYNW